MASIEMILKVWIPLSLALWSEKDVYKRQAQHQLGASVENFTAQGSSVEKGESLYDTVKTFESIGYDAVSYTHLDVYKRQTLYRGQVSLYINMVPL